MTVLDFGPDAMDQAMGLAIRVRRHALGISQSGLGEAIGVSFQQIQKYERGANRVSFSTLTRIAEALRCRVVDLVADVEGMGADGARSASAFDLPEAAPLLDALAEIRSPSQRRAILALARALAREGSDAQAEGAVA